MARLTPMNSFSLALALLLVGAPLQAAELVGEIHWPPRPTGEASQGPMAGRVVDFNPASGVYHLPSCKWARWCSIHCRPVPESSAQAQGGRPCQVCLGQVKKSNSSPLDFRFILKKSYRPISPQTHTVRHFTKPIDIVEATGSSPVPPRFFKK